MSHFNADTSLNLTTTYRPIVSDHSRPTFAPYPVSHPAPPSESHHLSTQAAVAAALNAAINVSNPIATTQNYQHHLDHNDPTISNINHRLPNIDLRPMRSHIPSDHVSQLHHPSVSIPISAAMSATLALPSSHPITHLPTSQQPITSYSSPLPISQLTDHTFDASPLHRSSNQIPNPISTATALMHNLHPAVKQHPSVSMLNAVIPAAAQLFENTRRRPPAGVRKRNSSSANTTSASTTRPRKAKTGPANYLCPLTGCGKAFRMQGDLQTHMRKHTGVEPFKCSFPHCNMRYKWRSSLSHHEGLHRKAKDFRLKPRRKRRNTTVTYPLAALAALPGGLTTHMPTASIPMDHAAVTSLGLDINPPNPTIPTAAPLNPSLEAPVLRNTSLNNPGSVNATQLANLP